MEGLSKQLLVVRPLLMIFLFSALAGLIVAYRLSGIDVDPPLLLFWVIISGSMVLIVGLRLYRIQWLITPAVGILSTLASGGYSVTLYNPGNCGGIFTFSGYPYPWFQTIIPNNCVIGRPLVIPPPPFHGPLFLVDAIFYTLLALTILESYLGTLQFSTNRRLYRGYVVRRGKSSPQPSGEAADTLEALGLQSPAQRAQPVKSRRKIWVTVLVIVLVVGGFGAVLALNAIAHPAQNVSVVNGTVNVSPGLTRSFTFTVPSGATNAHVIGSFSASGGSGNDVTVYVNDSYGGILYIRGYVSTGNFDVQLGSGYTYSLIFDNASTVSTKTVQAQATLSYNR